MRINFKIFLYLYVLIGFSISKAGAFDDFFKAIVFDQVPVVGKLIYRGMDPNTPTEKGEPALVFAVRSGAPKTVAFLLKQPGIQLDATNTADETALMLAANANDLASANLLIEAGASVMPWECAIGRSKAPGFVLRGAAIRLATHAVSAADVAH